MSAGVVPYGSAVAKPAGLLNAALAELHATEMAGGPQAVAERSSGARNGLAPDDLTAAYLSLPRETGAARAA